MDSTDIQKPRRVARRLTPAEYRKARMAAALSPGDHVEYGLTAEVKHPRKGSWWVKAGITTSVRDGEDGVAAKERAKEYVHMFIEEGVEEILAD